MLKPFVVLEILLALCLLAGPVFATETGVPDGTGYPVTPAAATTGTGEAGITAPDPGDAPTVSDPVPEGSPDYSGESYPKIWTDKADYFFFEIVTISGAGFHPNTGVTVTLSSPVSVIREWTVTSDGSGGFVTEYTAGLGEPDYTVSATDGISTAGTSFTDSTPPKEVLTIIKHVDNTGGGTKQASDFYIYVYHAGVKEYALNGSETGVPSLTMTGNYLVNESPVSGYTPSYSSGCQGTLVKGYRKTCIITNTYQPCEPPVITTQPASRAATVGEPVTFSVVSSGDSLSYRWYKGTSRISDATGSSYTIPSVVTADAGSYSVEVSQSCGGLAVSDSAILRVDKADAVITVAGYTGTYDGSAHGATGTATGSGGVDLSGLLGLGSTYSSVPGGTASWTFQGNDDYRAASGSVPVLINKRTITIAADPQTRIFGQADPALTYRITSGTLVSGDSFTGALAREPGQDAGTYAITQGSLALGENYDLSYTGNTLEITRADAVVTVSGFAGTYDATPHGATGTATGPGGLNLDDQLDLGPQFTDCPGGTAHWVFTGGRNYNDQAGDAGIVISKADPIISVSGYTGTYDSAAHGATGSATGVMDEELAGLDLGASFTNVPGGTATWKFTDLTGNYHDAAGSVAIVIGKADAAISVTPYTVIYDGNAHTATGSAEGVASLDGLSLDGTTHTSPGTYTDTWTFTDITGNYRDATGTVTDKIWYTVGNNGEFLPPVDSNGDSLFRLGSTIPAKFRVKDAYGTPVATAVANLTFLKVSDALSGDDLEAVSTAAATTGNQFRYDPAGDLYIFNMATKSLSPGTYRITARLDSGQIITEKISLRK